MLKRISASEIKIIKGLSRAEQETTVVIGREDTLAKIYTSDNTVLTTLKKRAIANPKEWSVAVYENKDGNPTGYTFYCPKRFVSFRTRSLSRNHAQEAEYEDIGGEDEEIIKGE